MIVLIYNVFDFFESFKKTNFEKKKKKTCNLEERKTE